MKRFGEREDGPREEKRQKFEQRGHDGRSRPPSGHHDSRRDHQKDSRADDRGRLSHEDALAQLPPAVSKSGQVPSYVHFQVKSGLPELPPVLDPALATAPFKHKSAVKHVRSNVGTSDMTYERLEFLGDAYIELIASRLLDERFGHLPAGQQSQLRELLVKNETLAEYSRAYGFDKRIEAASIDIMLEDSKRKGNKGFNKVMGDVFEAYVAAVIRSDHESGFAIAEKWLTTLWAPKLLDAYKNDPSYAARHTLVTLHDDGMDPRTVYNPTAKIELQKRILGRDVKLDYVMDRPPVELKGPQLGQNRHFVALYLTGYAYEKKLLGKGEGKNKVEAGNWAATEAMHGDARTIVEDCEAQLKIRKQVAAEEKARKEEEKKKAQAASKAGE